MEDDPDVLFLKMERIRGLLVAAARRACAARFADRLEQDLLEVPDICLETAMIKQLILASSCCVAIALNGFSTPATAAKAGKGTNEDLPTYCARVGTDDTVREYTPGLRDRTLRAYRSIRGGADTQSQGIGTSQEDPSELDAHLKVDANYRCMDGKVMVCSVGANLPCVKINMARNIPEIAKYCRENPGAADGHDLALAIIGHDTGHSFQCRHGRAVVTGTIWALDKRGFARRIWFVLPD